MHSMVILRREINDDERPIVVPLACWIIRWSSKHFCHRPDLTIVLFEFSVYDRTESVYTSINGGDQFIEVGFNLSSTVFKCADENSDRDVKSSMSPLHSSRLILYFHTKNRISRRCINLGSSMRALTPMNLAILFLGSILSKEMIKPSFILPLDSFAGKDGVHYSVPQLTEYLGAVMHPTLIEFSDRVGIHSYGLLILTALLFAFMVSSRRAKTVGVDPDDLPLMYLLVAMCGILGARLFYFFVFRHSQFFGKSPYFL